MKFQFSFRKMDPSNALIQLAERKFSRCIQKFVTKPVHVHIQFGLDHHLHSAKIQLKAGDGFDTEIEQSGQDMYSLIDSMAEKFNRILRRKKEKLKHHKGIKSLHNNPFEDVPALA